MNRFANLFQRINLHIQTWKIAYEEARREEPTRLVRGKDVEFLPAVIEIQEAPPSPIGRTVMWTIVCLFTLAIVWAAFGRIDIIAVAQGKIVPSNRSKLVQPLETGVVKAIHVRDGQRVKQGDVLIELDTTAGADRERFVNEYRATQTEVARLRALMARKDTFEPPQGVDSVFVRTQLSRLKDQLAEITALENQARIYKELRAQQAVSEMQYLEADRQRAQKAQEHAAALSDAETRMFTLSKELNKAEMRASQQRLVAPLDGIVQQLAIHTVGGVVTPAQQLMVIAPQKDQLEVEAWIENKDVGFVSENQDAEIKIESFPFTRYGTIEGKVVNLSGDAVPIEKVGLVYTARVSMAKSTIEVTSGKEVKLSPGMAVTVEVKTGERRIIEYFLAPLLKGVKEAARER
jgi:hemolysin D